METFLGSLIIGLCVLSIINLGLILAIVFSKTGSFGSCMHLKLNARIVGGHKVTSNRYPFAACIFIKKHEDVQDSFKCGASIITQYWIITAAHCFEDNIKLKYMVVYANNLVWWKGTVHQLVYKIVHDKFDETFSVENDVALAKVKTPFTGRFENPISIANNRYQYQTNTSVKVLGWGISHSVLKPGDTATDNLHEVDLRILHQKYCKKVYEEGRKPDKITKSMFCAADYKGGKDACVFDSGGPVLHGKLLIGLVSWGRECGDFKNPSVYTRLGIFEKWISAKGKKIDSTFHPHFTDKS